MCVIAYEILGMQIEARQITRIGFNQVLYTNSEKS